MIGASDHAGEIIQGERFEFGKNWSQFLSSINENRILAAEQSIKDWLEVDDLHGKSFLDIGSGSGLFSLAARKLGARVSSFDYDPQSVACTKELKRRHFPADAQWSIQEGSALNTEFLKSLGTFDVVYAWGVLHHTGAMWQALENASQLAASGGRLVISIYNDQGKASQRWTTIKHTYNRLPSKFRFLILWPAFVYLWGPRLFRDLLRMKPLDRWKKHGLERGMSAWSDLVDWVGGYPFEVAKPEEIFDFYYKKGFRLVKLRTWGGGAGCNEFVFVNHSQ